MVATHLFRPERLASAVAGVVAAAGSRREEADAVAANLVEANLRGHDSHGVGMLPRYVDAVLEGGLAVNAHAKVVLDTGPLLSLDGRSGFGQVIGAEAMRLGIERAKKHGVCVVALAHSHHLGRIGHWAEQCIDAGLVSIHFVNVLARPIVAPFGGRDARLGTNPFCVGVPRPGRDPVVLDFATSKIAQGKTRVAYNKGVPIEPGTIIDDRGEPTTDPRYTVVEPTGALLPFGEHKGGGLGLVCELLGGALAGGATGSGPHDGSRKVLNSMFSVIVNAGQLGTAANLAREVESYLAWHIASPAAAGLDRVRFPGETERETKARRQVEGIAVDAVTWGEIVAAGSRVGVAGEALREVAGHGIVSSGWLWIAIALVAALVVLALVVAGRKKADSAAPPLAEPEAPAALADPSGEGVLAADAKPLDAEMPADAPAVVVDTLPPVEAPPVAAPPAPPPPPPAPSLAAPPVAAPIAPPPSAAPRPAPKPYEPVTVTVAPTPPRPPPPVVERVLAISPATAAEWDAAEPLPLSPVQATALAMLVAPAAAGGEKVAVSFAGEAALRLARGEPGTAQALASAASASSSSGGGKPRWLDSVAATTLAANALAAIANSRHLGALGDECRDLKTAIAAWPAKPAGGGEPRLKPIVHDAARFAREARDNYPSVVGKAAFRERIVAAWGAARDVWRDAMARSDSLRQQLEPSLAAPRFGEVQVERALALWRESREAGQQLDLAVRLLAGLHTLRVAVGESPSPAEGDVLRSALAALSAGAEQDADLAARTAAREKEAKGDPYVGRGEFEANRAALRKLVAQADPQGVAATLARVERAASARPPGIEGRLLVALVGNACEMRLPTA